MALATSLQSNGAIPFGIAPGLVNRPSTLATSAIAPKATVSPIQQGNVQGALTKNTTPLKKTTTIDSQGNTTTQEYHPSSTGTSTGGSTTTPAPIYSTADGHKLLPGEAPDSIQQKPIPVDPTSNAQRVVTAGQQTPGEQTAQTNLYNASNQGNSAALNNQYNTAGQDIQKLTAAEQNVGLAPFAGSQNTLSQDTTNQLGGSYANIFRPQSTANLQGETGLLNPELNQAMTAAGLSQSQALAEQQLATQGAQAGLTAQQNIAGRGLTGAENVLDNTLPSQAAYGQTVFNPVTGQYENPTNTNFGTGPQANTNIASYNQATSSNNLLDQGSATLNSLFPKAISDSQAASQVLTPDQQRIPILRLMALISGGTLGTDPSLSGLVNDINAIQGAYKTATGNDLVIPPTATLTQLNQIQSTARSNMASAKTGNNAIISKFTTGGGSNTTTGAFSDSSFYGG